MTFADVKAPVIPAAKAVREPTGLPARNSGKEDLAGLCRRAASLPSTYQFCLSLNPSLELIKVCGLTAQLPDSFIECIQSGIQPDQALACGNVDDFVYAYPYCLVMAKERGLSFDSIMSCSLQSNSLPAYTTCLEQIYPHLKIEETP